MGFQPTILGKNTILAFSAAVGLLDNACWSQVTYTDCSVSWGVYESTGTSLISGASAVGTVRIGNGVDTSGGSPIQYSPNANSPSWFNSGFWLVISRVSAA